MLRRLKVEVDQWEKADPSMPLQRLSTYGGVAPGEPGKAGQYRMVMPDKIVNGGRLGQGTRPSCSSTFRPATAYPCILPRFEWLLENPDVHLAMDRSQPMKRQKARQKIGTYDAADVNYACGRS